MHTRNGRTSTNVDSANLSRRQNCPHRVHYAAETVQNTDRILDLKEAGELWSTIWKMFRVDLLSHCATYTHICINYSAALGKQRLKTKAHGAGLITWARRPFVKIIIANGSCGEAKYKGAEKVPSVDYLAVLSNTQRNATHWMQHNAVVKSYPYFSPFVN